MNNNKHELIRILNGALTAMSKKAIRHGQEPVTLRKNLAALLTIVKVQQPISFARRDTGRDIRIQKQNLTPELVIVSKTVDDVKSVDSGISSDDDNLIRVNAERTEVTEKEITGDGDLYAASRKRVARNVDIYYNNTGVIHAYLNLMGLDPRVFLQKTFRRRHHMYHMKVIKKLMKILYDGRADEQLKKFGDVSRAAALKLQNATPDLPRRKYVGNGKYRHVSAAQKDGLRTILKQHVASTVKRAPIFPPPTSADVHTACKSAFDMLTTHHEWDTKFHSRLFSSDGHLTRMVRKQVRLIDNVFKAAQISQPSVSSCYERGRAKGGKSTVISESLDRVMELASEDEGVREKLQDFLKAILDELLMVILVQAMFAFGFEPSAHALPLSENQIWSLTVYLLSMIEQRCEGGVDRVVMTVEMSLPRGILEPISAFFRQLVKESSEDNISQGRTLFETMSRGLDLEKLDWGDSMYAEEHGLHSLAEHAKKVLNARVGEDLVHNVVTEMASKLDVSFFFETVVQSLVSNNDKLESALSRLSSEDPHACVSSEELKQVEKDMDVQFAKCRLLTIVGANAKIRIASIHSGALSWVAAVVQEVFIKVLRCLPPFQKSLTKQLINMTFSGKSELLSTVYSADLSKATDPMSISITRDTLIGFCDILERECGSFPTWIKRVIPTLINVQWCDYKDATGLVHTRPLRCGAPMGMGPGWTAMCLLNLHASLEAGFKLKHIFICGDDNISLGNENNCDKYEKNLEKLGLKPNKTKSFRSQTAGVFCEDLVLKIETYEELARLATFPELQNFFDKKVCAHLKSKPKEGHKNGTLVAIPLRKLGDINMAESAREGKRTLISRNNSETISAWQDYLGKTKNHAARWFAPENIGLPDREMPRILPQILSFASQQVETFNVDSALMDSFRDGIRKQEARNKKSWLAKNKKSRRQIVQDKAVKKLESVVPGGVKYGGKSGKVNLETAAMVMLLGMPSYKDKTVAGWKDLSDKTAKARKVMTEFAEVSRESKSVITRTQLEARMASGELSESQSERFIQIEDALTTLKTHHQTQFRTKNHGRRFVTKDLTTKRDVTWEITKRSLSYGRKVTAISKLVKKEKIQGRDILLWWISEDNKAASAMPKCFLSKNERIDIKRMLFHKTPTQASILKIMKYIRSGSRLYVPQKVALAALRMADETILSPKPNVYTIDLNPQVGEEATKATISTNFELYTKKIRFDKTDLINITED